MEATTTPVVRYEAPEERGSEFTSLIVALAEPPTEPEARIVLLGGGLLAEADAGRVAWVLTARGKARVAAEAYEERRAENGEDWCAGDDFDDDNDDSEEAAQ